MSAALHGVIAQFSEGEALMAAAQKARDAGYTKMDAFTPYAIEGLVDVLGNKDDRVPWITFFGGVIGASLGFTLQWWVSCVDYPLNIGSRPNLSWPSFIPITFECGVLMASLSGVIGMLMLNGLPRPHHPLFDAKNFEKSGEDKFFLCIESTDPAFEVEKTKAFLESINAEEVSEVVE